MTLEDIVLDVSKTLTERGKLYGDPTPLFERAAAIASLRTPGRVFSAHDVALVMEAMKDARAAFDPDNYDSLRDGLGYRIIATLLSGAQPEIPSTKEVAAKFSPARRVEEKKLADELERAVAEMNPKAGAAA